MPIAPDTIKAFYAALEDYITKSDRMTYQRGDPDARDDAILRREAETIIRSIRAKRFNDLASYICACEAVLERKMNIMSKASESGVGVIGSVKNTLPDLLLTKHGQCQ